MPPVASLVAKDLITAARDAHPTFDDRRHPDPVLLRALSRYQRQLVPRVAQYDGALLTSVLEQTLPLPDFAAGIALPDYIYAAGLEAESPASDPALPLQRVALDLVAWQANTRYYRAGYIRNNTLYLTGSPGDWTPFTKIRFIYVPEVDPLANPSAQLVLPNAAEPCLVAYLCAFMAQRGSQDKEQERPDAAFYRAAWREAEDEFFHMLARRRQALRAVVREVF
jgi:hypothetical protein